jgi:CheY-like chemotaxis protein
MTKGPIVIVEDDLDDQEIYGEAIRAIGLTNELRFFNGSQQALDYLLTTEEQPFIILSDINMPGMNGLELKKILSKTPTWQPKEFPLFLFPPMQQRFLFAMHIF